MICDSLAAFSVFHSGHHNCPLPCTTPQPLTVMPVELCAQSNDSFFGTTTAILDWYGVTGQYRTVLLGHVSTSGHAWMSPSIRRCVLERRRTGLRRNVWPSGSSTVSQSEAAKQLLTAAVSSVTLSPLAPQSKTLHRVPIPVAGEARNTTSATAILILLSCILEHFTVPVYVCLRLHCYRSRSHAGMVWYGTVDYDSRAHAGRVW